MGKQALSKELTRNWERQLRKGMLEYVVLLCLQNGSRHGYGLVSDIKKHIGFKVAEGTIYPLLKKLLIAKFITASWDMSNHGPPRKTYVLTSHGRDSLSERTLVWNRIVEGMEGLIKNAP